MELLKVGGLCCGFSSPAVQRTNNTLSLGFHIYSRALAAQNFTMPAMSPTMTDGNIASWKVKEGEIQLPEMRLHA